MLFKFSLTKFPLSNRKASENKAIISTKSYIFVTNNKIMMKIKIKESSLYIIIYKVKKNRTKKKQTNVPVRGT